MKQAPVDYTTFWSLVSSKSLLPQYVATVDTYYIFAVENNISWEVTVLKDGGVNQQDFETNHKAACNQPLEIKAATGRPSRVSMSPQPAGTVEHWKGFQITVPTGQTSGYVDISFPIEVYLRGGYIVSHDVDLDDWVSVDILVAANDAVYLPGLIDHAYLISDSMIDFKSDESMVFPPSLKLRVTLNIGSADLSDVHANILVDYFI